VTGNTWPPAAGPFARSIGGHFARRRLPDYSRRAGRRCGRPRSVR